MNLRRPDVLTLRVRDLEASVQFFHGVLGIPVKLRADGHVELQTDTVLLTLVSRRSDLPDEARGSNDSPALGWEVPDLEDAAAALRARGVVLTAPPPRCAGVSGRRLEFRDPDGHLLELIQYTA